MRPPDRAGDVCCARLARRCAAVGSSSSSKRRPKAVIGSSGGARRRPGRCRRGASSISRRSSIRGWSRTACPAPCVICAVGHLFDLLRDRVPVPLASARARRMCRTTGVSGSCARVAPGHGHDYIRRGCSWQWTPALAVASCDPTLPGVLMRFATVLALSLGGASLAAAQQPAPAPRPPRVRPSRCTPADLKAWKSIRHSVLSNDGKWFAYVLAPNEGDANVVIRSTGADGKETKFPIGDADAAAWRRRGPRWRGARRRWRSARRSAATPVGSRSPSIRRRPRVAVAAPVARAAVRRWRRRATAARRRDRRLRRRTRWRS